MIDAKLLTISRLIDRLDDGAVLAKDDFGLAFSLCKTIYDLSYLIVMAQSPASWARLTDAELQTAEAAFGQLFGCAYAVDPGICYPGTLGVGTYVKTDSMEYVLRCANAIWDFRVDLDNPAMRSKVVDLVRQSGLTLLALEPLMRHSRMRSNHRRAPERLASLAILELRYLLPRLGISNYRPAHRLSA